MGQSVADVRRSGGPWVTSTRPHPSESGGGVDALRVLAVLRGAGLWPSSLTTPGAAPVTVPRRVVAGPPATPPYDRRGRCSSSRPHGP